MRILAQLIRKLTHKQEAAPAPLVTASETQKKSPSPVNRDYVVYPYYLQSFTPITHA